MHLAASADCRVITMLITFTLYLTTFLNEYLYFLLNYIWK